MKAYSKGEDNNAKNSTTFFTYIKNIVNKDDNTMVSFDVSSFYTKISIVNTLNEIKNCVKTMIKLLGRQLYLKASFELVNMV